MTRRGDRLQRLAQIADLKATIAKSAASEALMMVTALRQRIDSLRNERQSMAALTPDPASARPHAAWLRQCDTQMRALRAEEARLRVEMEGRLDRARYEEGRRQVLDRLNDQAS